MRIRIALTLARTQSSTRLNGRLLLTSMLRNSNLQLPVLRLGSTKASNDNLATKPLV